MSRPSSSLVQSTSVQSEFTSLNRITKDLKQQNDAAERDQRLVEKQLEELRGVDRNLTIELQAVQESLGVLNGERSLMQQRRVRLNRQLQQERLAILELNDQVVRCQTKDAKRKHDYCQEMACLSDNLEALVRQFDNARMKNLVSTETVDYLLGVWRQKKRQVASKSEDGDPIIAAARLLKEATEKWTQAISTNEKLQKRIMACREEILAKKGDQVSPLAGIKVQTKAIGDSFKSILHLSTKKKRSILFSSQSCSLFFSLPLALPR
jgi:chromosome segregation ATPase